MIVWRISDYPNMNGEGGLFAAGRWHHRGQPVIYTADHTATALLEIYVHLEKRFLPETFQLFEIALPDAASLHTWTGPMEEDANVTRDFGTNWLASGESLVLQVPSAIVPNASNFIINPRHRDFHLVGTISALRYPFDKRLRAL
jgi:RES domain-containing protein